jgi:hypothetical protein
METRMKVLCNGNTKTHISFSKKISIFLLIIVIVGFSMNSCSKSSNFSIGENFVDEQTNLQTLDTFKVDLSTVLLDSIATNGGKVALVGQYEDSVFGSVSTRSYFNFEYKSNTVNETDIYDSAKFVLCYSKYYYGDTTKLMTISIQQLKKEIKLNETTNKLYNTSKIDYYDEILGTKTFYPRPLSPDTILYIHVDAFGKEIFDLVQNKDVKFTESESFLNYMKGFALTSESPAGKNATNINNAILGFTINPSHLLLKLYYHTAASVPEEKTFEYAIPSESTLSFNNIEYDPSGSPLRDIKTSKNILSSTKTNNVAFMQGMVGLVPKIQFPTLNDLLLTERWKILKAELIVTPVQPNFEYFKLPAKLYLYNTDKSNEMYSTLKNSSGSDVEATLTGDKLYNRDTEYTFDISNLLISESSNRYFDNEYGIMIDLSSSDIVSSVDRLQLTSKKYGVKLRLYYLTY